MRGAAPLGLFGTSIMRSSEHIKKKIMSHNLPFLALFSWTILRSLCFNKLLSYEIFKMELEKRPF